MPVCVFPITPLVHPIKLHLQLFDFLDICQYPEKKSANLMFVFDMCWTEVHTKQSSISCQRKYLGII